MNPFILMAQAFFNQQTQSQLQLQTQNLRNAGLRAAETGRRIALAGVFFALAGAFFFSALLVALIDLGLQIDRGGGISYSGLMISASILSAFGLITSFIGWLAGRDSRGDLPTVADDDSADLQQTAASPPTSELRTLLESVAVALLKEFLERQTRASAPPSDRARPETAP